MKTGLFFGSFNPIHIGHLIIANVMVENTDLQQVWFIVSPQNPFKSRHSLLHEFDRYDMVEAAIRDNYKFKVSDVEFNMPKPNYTINTLAYLDDKYKDHQFRLIIGEDNLKHFPNWKNAQKIIELFGLYVYPRPHADAPLPDAHPNVRFVDAPLIDISATFIRKAIKHNKSIKYLVPEAVVDIIEKKKFYW